MDQLGSYALRRSLGDTPVGELCEAIDRGAGRSVLIEIVRDDLVRDGAVKEACLGEARRLCGVSVEGLAPVVEPLDAQGKVGLVSRLPAGRSLREVIDDVGRLSWEPAGQLLVAVAQILKRLAEASPPLPHLDLRPERLWLDAAGSVTLVAAAGGKLLADSTVSAARSAPLLRYASPELLDGGVPAGPADCYALGLVLYELLGGAPPFQSSSIRTVINMHCVEAPPLLPAAVRNATPRALLALLDELLRKTPADRPTPADLAARAEQIVPDRARRLLGELGRESAAGPSAVASSKATAGSATARDRASGDPVEPASPALGPDDEKESDEPEAAAVPGATADRQLTPRQIVALVVAATLLAALLAYCASSGTSAPSEPRDGPVPTRPIAPEPPGFERDGVVPSRPLGQDAPEPTALPLQPFGPALGSPPSPSRAADPSAR